MGDEHDDWLSGIGVDVDSIVSNVTQAVTEVRTEVNQVTDTIVQDVSDAGKAIQQTGSEIIQDVSNAIPDIGNAALADLNSPSYVNNSNPPSALAGGGTASAGDSNFVAGGGDADAQAQKVTLTGKVQAIKAAYDQLNKIADVLQSKGSHYVTADDKPLLEAAKTIKTVYDGVIKLADAIDKCSGGDNADAIAKGGKAGGSMQKMIDAAEALSQVNKLNVSLKEMQDSPNQATVEAWAKNVGGTFDSFSSLIDMIPDGGLLNFEKDYFKGLMSAPKNYINAFINIMHAHYAAIDEEANISNSDQDAYNIKRDKITWKGPLTPIYVGAYAQPKNSDSKGLDDYMEDHRKSEGCDLYELNMTNGKVVLTSAITRDLADGDSAKAAWLSYVNGF